MLCSHSLVRLIPVVLAVLTVGGCTRDPNVRKAKYFSSGKDFAARARYAEAVVQYRNAIDIDPRFTAAHLELARVYLNLNARADAAREFQESLVLEPNNSQVKLELAPLLILARHNDKAAVLIQEVLKGDPKNSRAHAILGQSYADGRDLPNAIRELQTAIEIEPRVEYYAALGALDLASGNASEAE